MSLEWRGVRQDTGWWNFDLDIFVKRALPLAVSPH